MSLVTRYEAVIAALARYVASLIQIVATTLRATARAAMRSAQALQEYIAVKVARIRGQESVKEEDSDED
jgi:hypothetical protein